MDGFKIKELRLKKGLTQAQLAELLGYADKSAISQIENNKFELDSDRLIKCAQILGVSVLALLDDTSESEELANIFTNLSDKHKEALLNYAIFLRDQEDE